MINRSLARRNVPSVLGSFENLFNMFDDNWMDWPYGRSQQFGLLDAKEDGDKYIVTVDVPGVNKDQIEVALQNNILTIGCNASTDKEDKNEGYYIRERRSQSFSRSLKLPPVDDNSIEAKLNDGVLTLSIKKQAEASKRRIEIQ